MKSLFVAATVFAVIATVLGCDQIDARFTGSRPELRAEDLRADITIIGPRDRVERLIREINRDHLVTSLVKTQPE